MLHALATSLTLFSTVTWVWDWLKTNKGVQSYITGMYDRGMKNPPENPAIALMTGDMRWAALGNNTMMKMRKAVHVWLRARLKVITCSSIHGL